MEDQKPLTVVRLDVDSYKRLTAAHVVPNATGLVPVRGRNAQGKSSLIESMLAALLGKKAKSELPIHEGAHGAEVVLDLGDIVITRKWTRDSAGKAKTSLTIEDAHGRPKRGPQAVLDSLVGHFADPAAFIEMGAAEQVKTVLAVTGLAEEITKLEDVAAGYYDQRREVGRDVDRLGKALHEITIEVDALPVIPTQSTIEQLTDDLQEAKDRNADVEAFASDMRDAESRGKEASERMTKLLAEIEKLEGQIGEHRANWQKAADGFKSIMPINPEPIVEKLKAHEEAAKFAGRRQLLAEIEAQHDEVKQKHNKASAGLEATRASIAELLDKASFPIEGMSYDAEKKTLTIGGIPFSQASQAERLKAAASIAMAGSPTIRVMFAREGSLLDAESRQQLADIAEANGFQLWLEVVDSTAEGAGVWIEDGEAFQNDEA